jgi:hypothetical protein
MKKDCDKDGLDLVCMNVGIGNIGEYGIQLLLCHKHAGEIKRYVENKRIISRVR